eukprot:6547616-Prymnesium_polylepis.1
MDHPTRGHARRCLNAPNYDVGLSQSGWIGRGGGMDRPRGQTKVPEAEDAHTSSLIPAARLDRTCAIAQAVWCWT